MDECMNAAECMTIEEKRLKTESDTAWYAELYADYVKPVYRYIWTRVGKSREIAEDLAQETFLRIWKYLPLIAKKSVNMPGYVYRVAHNLVISYYRKKKEIPLDEKSNEIPIEIVSAIENGFELEAMWKTAEQLPETERTALALRYREGLEMEEIAHRLGKSTNAIKIILSRARKNLSQKNNKENSV